MNGSDQRPGSESAGCEDRNIARNELGEKAGQTGKKEDGRALHRRARPPRCPESRAVVRKGGCEALTGALTGRVSRCELSALRQIPGAGCGLVERGARARCGQPCGRLEEAHAAQKPAQRAGAGPSPKGAQPPRRYSRNRLLEFRRLQRAIASAFCREPAADAYFAAKRIGGEEADASGLANQPLPVGAERLDAADGRAVLAEGEDARQVASQGVMELVHLHVGLALRAPQDAAHALGHRRLVESRQQAAPGAELLARLEQAGFEGQGEVLAAAGSIEELDAAFALAEEPALKVALARRLGELQPVRGAARLLSVLEPEAAPFEKEEAASALEALLGERLGFDPEASPEANAEALARVRAFVERGRATAAALSE